MTPPNPDVKSKEKMRFICWACESDTRGACYSREYEGKKAVEKAAVKHSERYHSDMPRNDMDIESKSVNGWDISYGIMVGEQ
jgi:hypothetical protein